MWVCCFYYFNFFTNFRIKIVYSTKRILIIISAILILQMIYYFKEVTLMFQVIIFCTFKKKSNYFLYAEWGI